MEVKQILSAFFSVLSASSNALLIKAFPICFFLLLSVGMPLADALCMILVIMQMKVPSEKRKELFQTITSLLSLIRTAEGCLRCDFFHSMEDEQVLCLIAEWDSRKNLGKHRNSECFRVLRGAMHLLEEPCEMMSYRSLHQGDT
jgi:quinol monooxygenase YgiN